MIKNLTIILNLRLSDSRIQKLGIDIYKVLLRNFANKYDCEYSDNDEPFLIDNIHWALHEQGNWLWNSKFKYLKLKSVIKTIVLDHKNNTNLLQKDIQKFEVGDKIILKENIKNNYLGQNWINDVLVVTSISINSKENKNYNDSMNNMQLLNLERVDGITIPLSLYEDEVDRFEEQ